MVKNLPAHRPTRQKGVVLAVSLIMLLIMVVIGLASMQSTTLEEKMAGNYRDQNLSFQAAESALREGETWIGTRTAEPPLAAAGCTAQCDVWDVNTLLSEASSSSYVDVDLWGDTRARTTTATIPGVAESPKFFLEFQKYKRDRLNVGQQGDSSVRIYYGVVTQGKGGRASTRTVLQSSYTRRF
jgi:type IV pilus assembly protein PilX